MTLRIEAAGRGIIRFLSLLAVSGGLLSSAPTARTEDASAAVDLWKTAQNAASVHRFSTLFSAQDVRDRLSTDKGIAEAIAWCKQTGVTKVYIEEYRDGYRAERNALLYAKERFLGAGFLVSGCVTTTQVGKKSGGWNLISCYTDQPTQEKIQSIFEFAAGIFDEIMIDDFWFTDCTCEQCNQARIARTVTVGSKTFPVSGGTWEDYRGELMLQVSRERILAAARKVNPKARVIIKFPQWYDDFQERGYDVARETASFDRIWVGTETRDYGNKQWGGTAPYESYFIMRWLGEIGGVKSGGGWYDWLGTTEKTYLEQARQTILAGARESMLFCYGGLQGDTGPKDVAALRGEIPELLQVAREVHKRTPIGIAAYKPISSHPENEKLVFDFVGMLGLPLVPCHEFPADARAAFFSLHALKDPEIEVKLDRFIKSGRPVLMTDGLADRLALKIDLTAKNIQILRIKGAPKSLLDLPRERVDEVRAAVLPAFKTTFRGPNHTGLYLFKDGSWVVENFAEDPASVEIDGKSMDVPARGWVQKWK